MLYKRIIMFQTHNYRMKNLCSNTSHEIHVLKLVPCAVNGRRISFCCGLGVVKHYVAVWCEGVCGGNGGGGGGGLPREMWEMSHTSASWVTAVCLTSHDSWPSLLPNVTWAHVKPALVAKALHRKQIKLIGFHNTVFFFVFEQVA